MKSAAKYTYFFIFLFLSTLISAQKPTAPIGLLATYQKYNNRIELTWQATAANHRYKIYRREQTKKSFDLIDSVEQNRYVDKKNLQFYKTYMYRIRAVAPNGIVSDMGTEGVGALLAIAGEHDTTVAPTIQSLKKCVDITLTQAKASAQGFTLKFLVSTKCATPKTVQLNLFRSDDALLDASDNLLSQQVFDLARTRGALTAKNNGEKTGGYLVLKVETDDDSFVVARKIE